MVWYETHLHPDVLNSRICKNYGGNLQAIVSWSFLGGRGPKFNKLPYPVLKIRDACPFHDFSHWEASPYFATQWWDDDIPELNSQQHQDGVNEMLQHIR